MLSTEKLQGLIADLQEEVTKQAAEPTAKKPAETSDVTMGGDDEVALVERKRQAAQEEWEKREAEGRKQAPLNETKKPRNGHAFLPIFQKFRPPRDIKRELLQTSIIRQSD